MDHSSIGTSDPGSQSPASLASFLSPDARPPAYIPENGVNEWGGQRSLYNDLGLLGEFHALFSHLGCFTFQRTQLSLILKNEICRVVVIVV